MRIPALAAFALLAACGNAALADAPANDGWYLSGPSQPQAAPSPVHIGAGTTADMAGKQAVYFLKDPGQYNGSNFELDRNISLAAWRGKRLRVSLRLKTDGDARAWANL